MSEMTPVLWDNENNRDLVYVGDTRHSFRRFTFNTVRLPGSNLPWTKTKDVMDALAKAHTLAP